MPETTTNTNESGAPQNDLEVALADAAAAKAQLQAVRAELDRAHADLADAREAIDASERRRAIDAALADAGAHDLEVARLLTEIAVSKMDAPDVALAVRDLAQHKPFLFRRPRAPHGVYAPPAPPHAAHPTGAHPGAAPTGAASPGATPTHARAQAHPESADERHAPRSSAMSARASEAPPIQLAALAENAAASGDRAALLRYLRLRRATLA